MRSLFNKKQLYEKLQSIGIDTILDDRNERPGVKFNDMDLIGIPVRITVGKKIEEDKVEFKLRNSEEVQVIEINEAIEKIERTFGDGSILPFT